MVSPAPTSESQSEEKAWLTFLPEKLVLSHVSLLETRDILISEEIWLGCKGKKNEIFAAVKLSLDRGAWGSYVDCTELGMPRVWYK